MKQPCVVFSCLFLIVVLCAVTSAPGENLPRPNVILVMTDDQGYGELSCHGNPVLQTPNLDRLHAQSLRLVDYHAAPMCTPTRGQLMTGRDAAVNGAINVSSGRTLLRPELPTMADVFTAAGYRTGIFGKWHLGDNYPFRPQDRGFQETLWFPSSHISSVPDVWDNDYFDDTFTRNGRRERLAGYCTDVFFREAMAWMKQCASEGKPFFAYLPTNAPHQPHWAPAEDVEAIRAAFATTPLPDVNPELMRELVPYLAMIRNIDTNMGRLERFLEESGLVENTILVFTSDNGTTFGHRYYPCGMRGHKTTLWEGGHRVPFFLRWPGGNLKAPSEIEGLTQSQDVLPTLIDLCALTKPDGAAWDGISLAAALKGESPVPEERMLVINYSRMPWTSYPLPDCRSRMRREGAGVLWKRWRLLEDRELYDLASDPLQERNVIDTHPEVAAKMRARLDQWWNRVGETANEPQRVVIGHDAENPAMLTACEWLDVFVDQQSQVRQGVRKNGWWELYVDRAGTYEFELRRWPRESDAALSASLPPVDVTAGRLLPGEALPIAQAKIQVGQSEQRRRVGEGEKCVVFRYELQPGPVRLYTWFADERGRDICGAYYVYVKRK